MAALQHIAPAHAVLVTLGLLSTASAGAVLGKTTPAPPRNFLATRQTTAFVNFYKAPGCGADDFVVALATNDGPIVGPSNCVEHRSLDHFADQQQDDGSFKVFMKPNPEAIFGSSGLAILRTPVTQVDDDYCGLAAQTMSSVDCFDATLSNNFMLQTCLKDQGCTPTARLLTRQDPSCYSVSKNDYTVADTSQSMVAASAINCPGPESCQQSITFEQSWSFSVSVEVSAGIEGLFSATMGVSYEEGKSKSTQTTFTVAPSQQGNIIWTPIKTCKFGTTSGCGNGVSDGELEMCKVNTLASGEPNGIYSFLETGRKLADHDPFAAALKL